MNEETETQLLVQYYDQLADDSIACRKLIETITARIENGDLDMEFGNDFLNVRNQLLISYLINLTKLIKDKSSGKQLESNPVVDRLTQLRVYIEKGQKIYKKMSYQIEKILSFGKNIDDKQNNPLVFKPAPHNLLDLDDGDDGGSGDDGDADDDEYANNQSSLGNKKSKVKSNVYIPPKVAAMMYDDDETAEVAKQKAIEKAKKRALSSNIIQDLRREYDEGPEEITTGSTRKKKVEKKLNEIKEFEEENFIRVTLSKKEKKSLKRPMASGHSLIDEVTNFGDTSFLTSEARPSNSSNKKSKSIKRKKGGSGGRKKFRKFKK